jgi:hypothetical protein
MAELAIDQERRFWLYRARRRIFKDAGVFNIFFMQFPEQASKKLIL